MDAILRRLAPLVLIVATLALGACPQTPPPVDPGSPTATTDAPIDCLKDVGQDAISSAIGRVNTTIASGLAGGSVESVIIASLEGLAVDVGPKALACAIQYVSLKLKFDADHAAGDVAARKDAEAKVAADYIAQHGLLFGPH